MQWLPWRSGDAEPEPEPEQASGLLGGLLTWGGGASAARQPAPQPAKSKTGTQQLLPWQRPGGTTETSGAAAAAKPGSALLSLWRSWDEGDSSSSRAEPQPEKPSVPYWRLPGTTAQQAAAAAPARPAAPIVSLAGGGIFYFWGECRASRMAGCWPAAPEGLGRCLPILLLPQESVTHHPLCSLRGCRGGRGQVSG